MPNNKNNKALKTGLGMAALAAAAAAGAYYFYGSKDAAKHRKALKGWAVKAQGEVMQKMEKLKNVNRETYNQIVDQVISRYRGMKGISVAELMALGRELKGHWDSIMKEVGKTEKKPVARSRKRSKTKSA